MKFNWIYKISDLPIRDQIMQSRNYNDGFFSDGWNELPDPALMKDLEKAAERILTALVNKEKIIIYGHDDMDGITSAYILYDFLTRLGSQNHGYFIPNRETDNHGIKENFIDRIKQEKYKLCITVDGGISEFEAVERINTLNCDVIITDHHLVQDKIPNALAVVNPKQKDCPYPYDMLAGVGVSFLLIETLCRLSDMEMPEHYIFWVAVGSIADKVPLTGANRIFVKHVLQNWDNFQPVYSSLFTVKERSGSISSKYQVIYGIISLFSNGREGGGNHLALQYLISRSNTILLSRLREMKKNNEIEMSRVRSFLKKITVNNSELGLIYFDEKCEIPVYLMGYCASAVSKKYKIPVIFLQKKNHIISSEARSTDGLHLLDCFEFCKDEFIQFGGHAKAAGFTMEESKIPAFKEKFYQYLNDHKEEILTNQKIRIDAVINGNQMEDLDMFLNSFLEYLQPFGQGNKPPLIMIKNVDPNKLDKRFYYNGFQDRDKRLNIVVEANGSYLNVIDYRGENES